MTPTAPSPTGGRHHPLLTAAVALAALASNAPWSHATASTPPADAALPDDVTSSIQAQLDASLAPGALRWDCCGVDAPPTGVSVAVRVPGYADLVLAAGTNVDGTPFDAAGPFSTGTLTGQTIIGTLAMQLADEGVLDLGATVDRWLPEQPNADTVTLQMLLDGTSGWAGFDDIDTASITADFGHIWTLPEVLATIAGQAPLHDPGVFDNDSYATGYTALLYVIEQVTGSTFDDLVADRIALPLGLEDTFVQQGDDQPATYQHGVFAFNNERHLTTDFPNVSYYTYLAADQAVVSTVGDMLDLLDAYVAGTLFTTPRTPGPTTLVGARIWDGSVFGLGMPINGYCPCQAVGEGNSVAVDTVGRGPGGIGTHSSMLRYPDGIDVVLHFNSDEAVDNTDLVEMARAIHDTVGAAVTEG